MLVDITPSLDPEFSFLRNDGENPERLQEGVWLWPDFNPEYGVKEELASNSSVDLHWPRKNGSFWNLSMEARLNFLRERRVANPYGVCDHALNILTHPDYISILNSPDRRFTVFLTEVRREDQPEDGGWRWHKWGPYIGNYKPQHEYLYYEKIDKVFVFKILEHI